MAPLPLRDVLALVVIVMLLAPNVPLNTSALFHPMEKSPVVFSVAPVATVNVPPPGFTPKVMLPP